MEKLANLFGAPRPKKGATSERSELIGYFHAQLVSEWDAKRFDPLTVRRVATQYLGHLKELRDLYYLKSTCEDARRRGKSFSKVFFGSLKARNDRAEDIVSNGE